MKNLKKQIQVKEIETRLLKTYGEQRCFLNYSTPFQLLVATILSAQCTDKTVNLVTPKLFQRWPDVASMAGCDIQELEKIIHPCGFFHAKAKHIRASAEVIQEKYHGVVPSSMKDLTSLPGVGRKTANVVLSHAFESPGLPVDTHVKRIVKRLGITKETDPVKIESCLCRLLPPKEWSCFSLLLITHGRACCTARNPSCSSCPIENCSYLKKSKKTAIVT